MFAVVLLIASCGDATGLGLAARGGGAAGGGAGASVAGVLERILQGEFFLVGGFGDGGLGGEGDGGFADGGGGVVGGEGGVFEDAWVVVSGVGRMGVEDSELVVLWKCVLPLGRLLESPGW